MKNFTLEEVENIGREILQEFIKMHNQEEEPEIALKENLVVIEFLTRFLFRLRTIERKEK